MCSVVLEKTEWSSSLCLTADQGQRESRPKSTKDPDTSMSSPTLTPLDDVAEVLLGVGPELADEGLAGPLDVGLPLVVPFEPTLHQNPKAVRKAQHAKMQSALVKNAQVVDLPIGIVVIGRILHQ